MHDWPLLIVPAALVKLPESTLLLLLPGLYVLGSLLRAPGVARRQVAVVFMAAWVPIIMFILFRPTVFNGLRHFFFVVPPLTVTDVQPAEQPAVPLGEEPSPAPSVAPTPEPSPAVAPPAASGEPQLAAIIEIPAQASAETDDTSEGGEWELLVGQVRDSVPSIVEIKRYLDGDEHIAPGGVRRARAESAWFMAADAMSGHRPAHGFS